MLCTRTLCAFVLAVAASVNPHAAAAVPPPGEKRWVHVDMGAPSRRVTRHLELADTPQDRARGLMHRTSLAQDGGMLFAFADSVPRTFWMRDTKIALDMIFVSAQRRVVQIIADAQPLRDTPKHCALPAQFVIELLAGQARALGISLGEQIDITLPRVPEP